VYSAWRERSSAATQAESRHWFKKPFSGPRPTKAGGYFHGARPTSEVVTGFARLAQDAALPGRAIEKVFTSLAALIQNISKAQARQQASSAGAISNTMNVIQEASPSHDLCRVTTATARALGAGRFRRVCARSVDGFTLPTVTEKRRRVADHGWPVIRR